MSNSRRQAVISTLTGSTANTIVIAIQAIVLTPLYIHEIGPRLYGAWLGSGDILIWLQAFDLGLPNLMIQRIGSARGRDDDTAIAEYFASGTVVLAVVACIIAAIAYGLSFWIPSWVHLDGNEALELQRCFSIGVIASALVILNNSVVGLSRGIQKTAFMSIAILFSSVAGFAVSLTLVLNGWGLWAIVWGLVTRAGISILGSMVFVFMVFKSDFKKLLCVKREIFREFISVSPVTALGGLSYAMMNQSESAMVAIFMRPEYAAILTVTRKAADLIRALVDMIGFASYGSFAHLVASNQRHRALQVHSEIRSVRFTIAIALVAGYIAVNASLVSVWVDTAQYGGAILTVLMGIQAIVVGDAFLMNYLYRATGPVVLGSVALIVESVARVPLMIGLLLLIGLPGIPLASILTAFVAGWFAYRWTYKDLIPFSEKNKESTIKVWLLRFSVVCVGMLACTFMYSASWTYVLVVGSAVTLTGFSILIPTDSILKNICSKLILRIVPKMT